MNTAIVIPDKLPWKLDITGYHAQDIDDDDVARFLWNHEARYAIHAANTYPKLVEALHNARANIRLLVSSTGGNDQTLDKWTRNIDDALQAVGAKI